MKCKICNENETDSTGGICYRCISPVSGGLYPAKTPAELFYPYNNLIDWALSRHT